MSTWTSSPGSRALVATLGLARPRPRQPSLAVALERRQPKFEGAMPSATSRDLLAGEPQRPQRENRPLALERRAMRDPLRRRRAIAKPRVTLLAEATHPLARRRHADAGGLSRRRQRPTCRPALDRRSGGGYSDTS